MEVKSRMLCFCLAAVIIGLSQPCEIDFHTEAAALMVLSGQSASVLCDATSCEPEVSHGALPGDNRDELTVLWKNPAGMEVAGTPGNVFAVHYRSRPMNRLMIMEAGGAIQGQYICSVMRNGLVIQERSYQVLVLDAVGSSRRTTTRRPRRHSRRRGDMDPEEEVISEIPFYRPVRSVRSYRSDWPRVHSIPAISESLQDVVSQEISHDFLEGNVQDFISQEISHDFLEGNRAHFTDSKTARAEYDRSPFLKTALSSFGHLRARRKSTNFLDLLSQHLGPVTDMKQHKGSSRYNTLPDGAYVVRDAEPSLRDAARHNPHPAASSLVAYVRNKRQAVTGMDTTQDTTTAEPRMSTMAAAGDTTAESTTWQENATKIDRTPKDTRNLTIFFVTNETTYTFPPQPVVTTAMTTTPRTTPAETTTRTPEKTTRPQGDGGEPGGKTTSKPCATVPQRGHPEWPEKEESFFGRHGVAAFAITLAVAILLLYALLMVIFMPKLLACRGKRANINGGTDKAALYRKKASGIEDEAPMTLLSESTHHADIQADEETVQSAQSDNKSFEDDGGEGASDSGPPAVSTFLLRQSSQKAKEEEEAARKESLTNEEEAPGATLGIDLDLGAGDSIKPGEEITLSPEEVRLEEQPAADPSLMPPPTEVAHEQSDPAAVVDSTRC